MTGLLVLGFKSRDSILGLNTKGIGRYEAMKIVYSDLSDSRGESNDPTNFTYTQPILHIHK